MKSNPAVLILLRIDQCLLHPRNMRRIYPQKDIQQLAASLRAYAQAHDGVGNLHPLIVTPAPATADQPDAYYIVDGNMRTLAGRSLADPSLRLEAKIVDQTEADQLLSMIISNTLRYDVDPISRALHYQSLKNDDGLSVLKIADATGEHPTVIYNHFKYLALEEPIQQLIAQGSLHKDLRAVNALLSIPDSAARVALAQAAADAGDSIRTIVATCARVIERLAEREKKKEKSQRGLKSKVKPQDTPLIKYATKKAVTPVPDLERTESLAAVRMAAAHMCAECEVKTEDLQNRVAEPAWSLIVNGAGETCRACDFQGLDAICRDCQGVKFLRYLLAPLPAPMSVPATPPEGKLDDNDTAIAGC